MWNKTWQGLELRWMILKTRSWTLGLIVTQRSMEKRSEILSTKSFLFYKSTGRMLSHWIKGAMKCHHNSGLMWFNLLLTGLNSCYHLMMVSIRTQSKQDQVYLHFSIKKATPWLKTKDTTGKIHYPCCICTDTMKHLHQSLTMMMKCNLLGYSEKRHVS